MLACFQVPAITPCILFNAYITTVSEVAQRNQVGDEKYADDEQLILSFKPNFFQDQRNAVRKME